MMIGEFYLIIGFINIYFKNYNGGPASSSGSIKYPVTIVLALLVAGLWFYFAGKVKIATLIVGIPVGLLALYMLLLILPALFGARMN
jgi:hypothetical protein